MDEDSTVYLYYEKDVDLINKLQLFNCLENVFFTKDEDTDYIKILYSEVEKSIKEKEFRTEIYDKEYMEDKSCKEIHRISQYNKNYKIKLSFIKLNHSNNKKLKGKIKRIRKSGELFQLCRDKRIVERINEASEELEKKLPL